MPLKFKCQCGTVLTVPTQRIGKSVRCPFCNETIVIPEPKSSPPSQAILPKRLQSGSPIDDKHSDQVGDIEPVQTKPRPSATPVATDSAKPDTAPEHSEARTAQSSQERVLPPTDEPNKNTVSPARSGRETRPQQCETDPQPSKSRDGEQADKPGRVRRGEDSTQQAQAVNADANDSIETAKDPTPKPSVADATPVDQKADANDQSIEKPAVEKPLERKTVPPSDPDDARSAADEQGKVQTPDRLPDRAPKQEPQSANPKQAADPKISKTAADKQGTRSKPRDVVKRPPPIKPGLAADAKAPPPLPKKSVKLGQAPAAGNRGKHDRRPKPKSDNKPDAAKSKHKSDKADSGPRVRGVEHAPANRWTAYYLALGVIFVGLINVTPAVHQAIQAFGSEPPQPFARWSYGALILGLIQITYAVYLIQLPDWSSVWVVALLSLATTTLYAALVSVLLLGGSDSSLLLSLQLAHGSRRSAGLWCLIMLIVSASLTYFAGRVGIRWHKVFSATYPTLRSYNDELVE